MKTWLVILANIFICNICLSQSIIRNYLIDFSNSNTTTVAYEDNGKQVLIVDSNLYICQVEVGKYCYAIYSTPYFRPTILISDSSFNFSDTISFPDTVRTTKICYSKISKQIWMVSYGRNVYSLKMRRLNLRGDVLIYNSWPRVSSSLIIPDNIQKIYPDDNNGFYMLSSRSTTFNGQNVEPWMVSRFDSSGNVLWQREYLYTFAYGKPQYLEKLANGKLYVSGFAGREIYTLEIDPATGTASNRKVIYNYASNNAFYYGYAVRMANGGYYVTGRSNRVSPNRDSISVRAMVDSTLNTQWQIYSLNLEYNPLSIADTTVWLVRKDSAYAISYEHYDFTGNLLHRIRLFTGYVYSGCAINDVAHYRNGTAAFIGTLDNNIYVGGALYFCKISRIGVPYNPTYPAWPPVPTSDTTTAVASISNEPALQLYPNPGHATMHVSHTGELYLYNLQGQLVMQRSTQAGDVISTSSLPSGAYLAHFQTKTGWLTSRWIKE